MRLKDSNYALLEDLKLIQLPSKGSSTVSDFLVNINRLLSETELSVVPAVL